MRGAERKKGEKTQQQKGWIILPRGVRGNRLCLNSPHASQSARREIARTLTKEWEKSGKRRRDLGKHARGGLNRRTKVRRNPTQTQHTIS